MIKFEVLLFILTSVVLSETTDMPVIGVLAQEVEPTDPFRFNKTSYISASYIKAVEASGARAVPIFIRRPSEYYRSIMGKINGLVLPGGDSSLDAPNGYSVAARKLLDISLEMFNQGNPVPILGVCQGLEVLTYWTNNGSNILTKCSVDNVNLPLKFVPDYVNSTFYKYADSEDLEILAKTNSTSNHHYWCLTQKNLTLFNLNSIWRVLSISKYSNFQPFVSTMEMRGKPIAAVQFHPEKTAFEWETYQNNAHGRKAIKANRIFFDWLSEEARRNNNSFSSQEELFDALIYNYSPKYTGKLNMYNEQVYYFVDPPVEENAVR